MHCRGSDSVHEYGDAWMHAQALAQHTDDFGSGTTLTPATVRLVDEVRGVVIREYLMDLRGHTYILGVGLALSTRSNNCPPTELMGYPDPVRADCRYLRYAAVQHPSANGSRPHSLATALIDYGPSVMPGPLHIHGGGQPPEPLRPCVRKIW
jgi:hypothetical protein